MYPLFESIKIVDDKIFHFEEHYLRMQNSSFALWQHKINFPQLEKEIISKSKNGLQKCKVAYNYNDYRIELYPYYKRQINCIHLVVDNKIEYKFKYTNRRELIDLFEKYPSIDDIIIIQNDCITDTSYSNIALWNGVEWHTPRTPLFKGIKRKLLIEQKRIFEKEISVSAMQQYSKISLINAMLELGDLEINIENVIG